MSHPDQAVAGNKETLEDVMVSVTDTESALLLSKRTYSLKNNLFLEIFHSISVRVNDVITW